MSDTGLDQLQPAVLGDLSCLVAQRLPIPLQIVLPPLLGFCILELEDNDQPFETQLQIAWVSFGE